MEPSRDQSLPDMAPLRVYLALLPVKHQQDYARRAGTTLGYLRKALSQDRRKEEGHRFDGALALKLDEESGGAVPRGALRPDIWPPEAAVPEDPDTRRIEPFTENP